MPFFGEPFFEQKINFGVSSLLKSQVVINFWGVILENNSLGR